MKQVNVRLKEIENPKSKNDVYLALYSMLDDLAGYSDVIFKSLIEENYRPESSAELEIDNFMPQLKKIIIEHKCDDMDSLLDLLFFIKNKLEDEGLERNHFQYEVEPSITGSLFVSIAVFA